MSGVIYKAFSVLGAASERRVYCCPRSSATTASGLGTVRRPRLTRLRSSLVLGAHFPTRLGELPGHADIERACPRALRHSKLSLKKKKRDGTE